MKSVNPQSTPQENMNKKVTADQDSRTKVSIIF